MFKIDHNRVLLSRGESAVYIREITMNDKYATPYMLLSKFINPKIVISIKSNKNDKNAVLTYEALLGDETPRFTSKNVEDITSTSQVDTVGVLYRLYQNNKYIYYYYKPAEEYSETSTYPLGYIVIYNDTYYECTTKIDTPEEFDISHWTTASEGEVGNPAPYKCILRFDIQSEDTQKLRPATYYYDISLVANTTSDNSDYKEVWLEPTEFVIGGSY